ncbi:MAG: response regulator transcription factor [Sulfurimonas sp.]|nr:response regulator transcription factor [Sulfurimonas sp.]
MDLLEDYEVTHVRNGQNALDFTFKEKFDLYLLDINVPLIDGITLLKDLREADDTTPAIFLTSHKEKNKLFDAFSSGCDDYIKKPFDNDELLLRIKALLKRVDEKKVTCVGKLFLDTIHHRILYDDVELDLSVKEYTLLSLLMAHVDSTVPKELIINELWSIEEGGSDGALRVYVSRLKQLVPHIKIENIRAIGYKLVS